MSKLTLWKRWNVMLNDWPMSWKNLQPELKPYILIKGHLLRRTQVGITATKSKRNCHLKTKIWIATDRAFNNKASVTLINIHKYNNFRSQSQSLGRKPLANSHILISIISKLRAEISIHHYPTYPAYSAAHWLMAAEYPNLRNNLQPFLLPWTWPFCTLNQLSRGTKWDR